jgi:hypothetical protein
MFLYGEKETGKAPGTLLAKKTCMQKVYKHERTT